MRKGLLLLLALLHILPTPALADILELMDGTRLSGEINNRRTLRINPLSLRQITILVEGAGTPESKLRTFEATDVRLIIIDRGDANEVIDLEGLREQFPELVDRDALPHGGEAALEDTLVVPEDLVDTGNARTSASEPELLGRGLLAVTGGLVLTGIGAFVPFGGEERNALNVLMVVGGLGASALGVVWLVQYRRGSAAAGSQDSAPSELQIGLSLRF